MTVIAARGSDRQMDTVIKLLEALTDKTKAAETLGALMVAATAAEEAQRRLLAEQQRVNAEQAKEVADAKKRRDELIDEALNRITDDKAEWAGAKREQQAALTAWNERLSLRDADLAKREHDCSQAEEQARLAMDEAQRLQSLAREKADKAERLLEKFGQLKGLLE